MLDNGLMRRHPVSLKSISGWYILVSLKETVQLGSLLTVTISSKWTWWRQNPYARAWGK